MFAQVITYFRSKFIRFSIERELAAEVLRADRQFAALSKTAGAKGVSPRARMRAAKSKPLKSYAGRSLPGVLTTRLQEQNVDDSGNWWSLVRTSLRCNAEALKQLLMPSLDDLAKREEERLHRHIEKAFACEKLVQEAISREHNLQMKAQRDRREADKLLRRAKRKKHSKLPLDRKAALFNEVARTAERAALKYAELQKLRLPILKARLAELQAQVQSIQTGLSESSARRFALQTKETEDLLKRTRTGGASKAISEYERKIVEREAKREFVYSGMTKMRKMADVMENMEKQVLASEALAKEAEQKLAAIPASQVETLSAIELKEALSVFAAVKEELSIEIERLSSTDSLMKGRIAYLRGQEEIWRRRQSRCDEAGNSENSAQAAMRADSCLAAIIDMEEGLAIFAAASEPIAQKLAGIELVEAKVLARLSELETIE